MFLHLVTDHVLSTYYVPHSKDVINAKDIDFSPHSTVQGYFA